MFLFNCSSGSGYFVHQNVKSMTQAVSKNINDMPVSQALHYSTVSDQRSPDGNHGRINNDPLVESQNEANWKYEKGKTDMDSDEDVFVPFSARSIAASPLPFKMPKVPNPDECKPIRFLKLCFEICIKKTGDHSTSRPQTVENPIFFRKCK